MAHPAPDLLALIALGEDVDTDVIEHVASCDPCLDEVQALQQVVAVGRSLGPEDRLQHPHPRVWQAISTAVSDGRVIPLPGAVTLRQPSPVVPPAEPEPVELGGVSRDAPVAPVAPAVRPLFRRRWFPAAAAAVLALVVGIGGTIGVGRLVAPSQDVVGATQLNALPRWKGSNGTAAVEKGIDGQRSLVITLEVPTSYALDGTLVVWMSDSRAQDMVAMGSMSGLSGRFPIPDNMSIAGHPIIDVSLEPPNDTDPLHSDISVVRGRLKL